LERCLEFDSEYGTKAHLCCLRSLLSQYLSTFLPLISNNDFAFEIMDERIRADDAAIIEWLKSRA
jgi:hypothetical protein